MKKLLLILFPLILAGCTSSVKLLTFDAVLQGGAVEGAGFVQLPGSAYPIRHNMESVRNLNFAAMANKALEDAVVSKRKKWKWIYPANITAVDPSVPEIFTARKDDPRQITDAERRTLEKVRATLGTRYYFVIENISVKDVSSPQAPFTLIAGVCLQLWDFKEGKLVFRARDTSGPVPYSGEDFKKKIEDALFDLFREMIAALPKT